MKSLEMQMRFISYSLWHDVASNIFNVIHNYYEFYTAVDSWYFNYDTKQIQYNSRLTAFLAID